MLNFTRIVQFLMISILISACNSGKNDTRKPVADKEIEVKKEADNQTNDQSAEEVDNKQEPLAITDDINPASGDYELIYISNGSLFFYDTDNNISKKLNTPEMIFSCAYDAKRERLYYLTDADESGNLWLKKADFNDNNITISWLENLELKKDFCMTWTYGEKSRFLINSDTLFIEHGYEMHEGFRNLLGYSLDTEQRVDFESNDLHNRLYTAQYESGLTDSLKTLDIDKSRELYLVRSADTVKISNTHMLDKEIAEYDPEFVKDFGCYDLSADTTKLIFGVYTSFGDLAHGPYFIVNIDGTMQKKLNNDGISRKTQPVWIDNNKLIYMSEDESGNEMTSLRIVSGADNNIHEIATGVDYFIIL
ncbi:MAG: hypothetical protein N4A72_14175 [Bacteroidales bacterium]|jgi:hypothetical protein|nr:hypothetical protein [Bacteroidales bacterium]